MADYLYLDIETIPTSDPETVAQIAGTITPPGNISKADTLAAWEAEKKPALVAEAVARTSFNGAHGSICCVGFAWNDDEPQSIMRVPGKADEKPLLAALAMHLANSRPSLETPVIVGHYVAGFDLRFIWQRAFVLGVRLPAWFPRDPKPWSREVHDTMAMWAGGKDSISLDNLCRALGLPGKDNIDGSQVAGLFAAGEYDAIADYCRADVERVRQVHRKMLFAFGEAA